MLFLLATPLLEIIVAQPRDVNSRVVLPNGSSHFEGTTEIKFYLINLKLFVTQKS